MTYLTADQILRYHDEALTFGGAAGVRSEHALFVAVMQPQQSVFGEDAYPSISEKAAAYAFFLAEGHPFVDGNKRTAVLTMLAFLDINGHEFAATDEEIEAAIVGVAANATSQQDFFTWVVEHVKPVNG